MARRPIKLEDYVRRRAGHVMVSYQKRLYMWGGYMEEPHETNYNVNTPSLSHFHDPCEIWIYEPLLNIWHRKICNGNIPSPLSGACAGVVGNHMYLFGGFHGTPPFEGAMNNLWQLDLETFKWTLLSPDSFQPFPCDKSASWVYGNRFYVHGGYGPTIPINVIPPVHVEFQVEAGTTYKGWQGQLIYYDTDLNKWIWPKVSGTKPTPRAAHAAAVLKNKAYIFGGRHKDTRLNDLFSLDLQSHTWSTVLCGEHCLYPRGRSWHTLNAIADDRLLVYGGFSTECQVLNDAWIFNTTTSTWTCLNRHYPKRLWHCGASMKTSEVTYLGGIKSKILSDDEPKVIADDSSELVEGLWEEVELDYDHGQPRCDHCASSLSPGQLWIVSGLTQPFYITMHLLIEHAEDMLKIRFSPPSLFELVLEYISTKRCVPKSAWSQLTPVIQKILQIRTDPFEIHGV